MDYLASISPFSSFDLSDYTAGADAAAPLADVSNSSPAMSTYTTTGTGSGVFVDSGWQNALLGGLTTALNYAIKRDAYDHGMIPAAGAATAQQVVVQQKQTNGLFLLLLVIGAVVVLK